VKTFKIGGVHPSENKLSATSPIRQAGLPKQAVFSLYQHIGAPAKAIVAKCKEAGLIMTNAGATFPYGKDPKDTNIRIAPSFPTPEELEVATQIFVLSVKLVSIDKILENK
jgi:DNA-binding transcriptional MocR family regulator